MEVIFNISDILMKKNFIFFGKVDYDCAENRVKITFSYYSEIWQVDE